MSTIVAHSLFYALQIILVRGCMGLVLRTRASRLNKLSSGVGDEGK